MDKHNEEAITIETNTISDVVKLICRREELRKDRKEGDGGQRKTG
jgi:hypothetical protein